MIESILDIPVEQVLVVVCGLMFAAFVGAVVLLILAAREMADLEIPEDADFFETLQMVPITVPLALDLLDMAFDFFAAPIAWVALELLGLKALQMITVFEGIIPGTQLIPTMTAAWVVSRMMKNKRRTDGRDMLQDYQRGLPNPLQRDYSLADRYRSRDLLGSGEPSGSSGGALSSRAGRSLPPSFSDEDVVEGEFFEEDYVEPPPDYYDDDEPW